MPSIEWTRYLPYQLIMKSTLGSICTLKLAPKLDRTKSQAIVLLFPREHGVRHRFLHKINSVDCMMDSPENIGARVNKVLYPTEL